MSRVATIGSEPRKTIARRLPEAKQTIPHIYLTVDVRLDALLKLRGELNAALESQGVKLSVNDRVVKALVQVLKCNVSFAGDELRMYSRTDISVAVAVPSGLGTPIIVDADNKSVSAIATVMKALAAKAREGKLQPHEFQGATGSFDHGAIDGADGAELMRAFKALVEVPLGLVA